MKHILFTFFFTFKIFNLLAQHPAWQNIASTNTILCMAEEGDTWWIGTKEAGLIEYNTITHEKKLHDKATSPLRSSTITAVMVASDGTKWIGTEDAGLYQLKSNIWTQVKINGEIPGPRIFDLHIDKEGTLWMGTVGLYKLKGNIWTVQNKKSQSLPFDFVSKIQKDSDGTLWVAADNKISSLDGTTWKTYTSANIGLNFYKVNNIHIDSKNNKWFATNTGLLRYDDAVWTVYKESNSGLPYDEVGGITSTSDGKVWVSTTAGVASYDGTNWRNYVVENARKVNVGPQSIFYLNEKNLITSTLTSGLYQFDQDKWLEKKININPLEAAYTEQIYNDDQGNIWMTNSNHLLKYNSNGWKAYLLPDKFIGTNYTEIKADQNGQIWISKVGAGVATLENEQFKTFDLPSLGFTSNVTLLGFDSSNNLWVATTSDGMIKYDGTTWTMVNKSNSGMPSNNIRSMGVDSKGKKWFGTSAGLATFDDVNWVVYNTSNSSIPSNSVSDIHILPNDDVILISSDYVVKYDGTNWTKLPTAFKNTFNSPLKVLSNSKSEIWSGMTYGLVSFKDDIVTEFSPSNSPLLDQMVRSIAIDKDDKIWALTNLGISVYNPNYKVAVDDTNLDKDSKLIYVHPNPTHQFISFSNSAPAYLQLYNISGQLVVEKHINEHDQLDISLMKAGIYIARLQLSNKQVQAIKIIKQ